jgi:ArsR family transcriptional regulator, arsenate/arsenite/antimonite-responsive transcriptional repressor
MDEGRDKRSESGGGRSAAAAADCTPMRPKRIKRDTALIGAASMFKALADETRLHILQVLSESERDLCACDIEQQFSLAQPTISHHMKILREAGLVGAEKRGAWVYYSIQSAGRKALQAAEKLTKRTTRLR